MTKTHTQTNAFPGRVIPPGEVPKAEPKELEQIDAFPGMETPRAKVRKIGKKKADPINQGDLMNPDKITRGNLPQDQRGIFDDGSNQTT